VAKSVQLVVRGVKGGPTHVSRTLKSRNNASRWLKFHVHVSRKFTKQKDIAWLDLFRMLCAELPLPRFSALALRPAYSTICRLKVSSEWCSFFSVILILSFPPRKPREPGDLGSTMQTTLSRIRTPSSTVLVLGCSTVITWITQSYETESSRYATGHMQPPRSVVTQDLFKLDTTVTLRELPESSAFLCTLHRSS